MRRWDSKRVRPIAVFSGIDARRDDEHIPWYVADLLRRGAMSRFVERHVG